MGLSKNLMIQLYSYEEEQLDDFLTESQADECVIHQPDSSLDEAVPF